MGNRPIPSHKGMVMTAAFCAAVGLRPRKLDESMALRRKQIPVIIEINDRRRASGLPEIWWKKVETMSTRVSRCRPTSKPDILSPLETIARIDGLLQKC
jgi:hypothetical protein